MTRPFRFAVQSFNAESAAQWKDRARAAVDVLALHVELQARFKHHLAA